jgi:hypothetical protein
VIPEGIDLFVDRICGYFPTTNIARNTVKSAWRHEDLLINLSDEDAKRVLSLIQVETTFPTLNRVKQLIRSATHKSFNGFCGMCENGWVYIDPVTENNITYNVVGRCVCSGGKHESKVGMQEVFDYIDDVHTTE